MAKSARILLLLVICTVAWSAEGADWPHWRGAHRSDIVDEASGFDGRDWPVAEAWKANVGDGSTSPIVVDGKVYTFGHRGGRDEVVCLDAATGKSIWSAAYDCPPYGRKANGDQGIYRGASSTPAFDQVTGLLYTLSIDGDLHCWDAKERGKPLWHINLYDAYDPPQRPRVARSGQRDYGSTTSPLIYGDWVIIEVGGKSGNTIAFDKRTGKQVWASENRDPAGHTGGLAPLTVEGVPCIAVLTHFRLLVMRVDTGHAGQTVAEYDWVTEFSNSIASPAVHENFVVITSGYNHQTMCKLEITLRGARKVWERDFTSQVCSPVIHKGHIYWAWRDVYCLDFETGQQKWKGPSGLGDPGSCIVTSDDRLIACCNEGDLLLLETAARSPNRPAVLARRNRIFSADAWPHVVLAGGRLYCKDRSGNLKCFLVGEAAKVARVDPPPPDRPAPQTSTPPYVERPIDLTSWPGTEGLLLAWRADFSDRRVIGYENGKKQSWEAVLADAARHDARRGFLLAGGACRIEAANDALLSALKETNELTIEVVLNSDNDRQDGPTRIVSFSSDPYHRNFTLGQERGNFILRLRTPSTGENGQSPEVALAPVTPGKAQHLIVTYRDGHLVTYVSGRQAHQTGEVRGDFRNWTPQHFLLGDEHDGDRDWSGAIERLAILSRFIGPQEAARRFELSKP